MDGGAEVHEEEDHRCPRGRHVVIEDALDVTHGGLGGRRVHGQIKGQDKQNDRDDHRSREFSVHRCSRAESYSAWNTVSKSSRQTTVKMMSYPANNFI